MQHPADGTLRRLLDEPQTSGVDRDHVGRCARCRSRSAELAMTAADAARALSVADAVPAVAGAALGHVQRRLREAPAATSPLTARPVGAFAALAAAAVLAVALAFAPVRTLATSFLAIFEPQQFVAVPVSRADMDQLRALPDLGAYGTFHSGRNIAHASTTSAQAAAQIARFRVAVPAYLPAGLDPRGHFTVLGTTTSRFTFSAARARAAAAAAHAQPAPMSANLDGSTLQASIGPMVVAFYSTGANAQLFEGMHTLHRRHQHFRRDDFTGIAVVQGPVPRVWSSGASVDEIERYLLSQPGVPPQLAAEIRAIGDPASTLPIPIPIDREYAQPVVVHGRSGLGIGDNTGLGAGVVWQDGGQLYAVAGTYSAREVLAIANSLR